MNRAAGVTVNCEVMKIEKVNQIHRYYICFLVMAALSAQGVETVRLEELDLSKVRQGHGKPQINRSIRGKTLSVGGEQFAHGLGTHAMMSLWINLEGKAERFEAKVGVDDAAGRAGSVTFEIIGDERSLWKSGVMRRGDRPKEVDIALKNIHLLALVVGDAGDGITDDHADWVEARFITTAKPQTIDAPPEPRIILTPKPGREPRINGPLVYGCRSGHTFLYRIPCQGERPISFAAEGLPASLKLDPETGIIGGTAPERGEYQATLIARNARGKALRQFKIVSGDILALTPPMGWNDWYAHHDHISDKLMREAADAMVANGMADVGYQYVNIDDCWANSAANSDPERIGPFRDESGTIIPNEHFPNMKALTDYIHAKGLKAGIYSSPGPTTCAHYAGSYQHEEQDARTFAGWGFDFLKYDWCSYSEVAGLIKASGNHGLSMEEIKQNHEIYMRPYRLMGGLLKQQPRDMLFNVCQYGMDNVWEWGASVGAQSWRTSGDLGFELEHVMDVALANAKHRDWSRPGSWNDPDYIQIGRIGSAWEKSEMVPCPLTPSEQYSFMSLWCLMAAPLFYSGDLGNMDEFTINVLCNPEVIEVDQDPLGQSARVVMLDDGAFLMIKDLEDGSKAVGLCYRGELKTKVTAKWSDVGISGRHQVRDLWRQKNLGSFSSEFTATIPRHGVVLVKITPEPRPPT